MNFYQAMQFDPFLLTQKIRHARSQGERRFFIKALVLRDLLLVAFAIIFVSGLSSIFGQENQSLAVVLFCIFLSIRFVDFGYKVTQSLGGLGIVLLILFVLPFVSEITLPLIKWLINFAALLAIFVITGSHPKMGNPGLYSFSYIFLMGTMQAENVVRIGARAQLLLFAFAGFALIFFMKHRQKHRGKTLASEYIGETFFSRRNLWLVYYALGVSLILLLGDFLSFKRFMWVGFAFSSLLSGYEAVDLKERFFDRLLGVVLGTLLFALSVQWIPVKILGVLGGLALGFCSFYRHKTIFNCFGALSTASVLFGLQTSITMRIIDNVIGLSLGSLYYFTMKRIRQKFPVAAK